MVRNFWRLALSILIVSPVVLSGCAHAGSMNMEDKAMQFSYTTNGGADGSINSYGNNEVSVSGDALRVQIGDSDGNRNVHGVGIYEQKLQGEYLESARKLSQLLCSPKDPKSDVPISDLYVAKCGGEMRSSYVRDFSRPVAIQIADLVDLLRNAGVQDGRKIVKLDVALVSIERAKDGFLVSIRFDNSGDYPIKFKTPDKWDTKMGRNMAILAANGFRMDSDADDPEIGFGLAGKSLENPGAFPDGEVNLAPHSSVTFKMKTTAASKFSAGTYDLNAGAFMDIEVTGIQSSLVRVDFHSDYKKPTRVTFDRDYPSTPQEREQWEAYQRTRLSYFPVKPGQTFAEDGLYRAVRTNSSTHRSLQLVPFKAGAVATTDNMKMLMERGNGLSLDGQVQWLWEGSAPTPVKQYSFDTIEETRQFCEPGSACPRSGRWVPRVAVGYSLSSQEYQYQLAGIVTLRRGDTMPPIEGNYPKWEWVGV